MAPISTFDLLDQEEENAFHRQRLLPVENRPLRRPIDRIFNAKSPLFAVPSKSQASAENVEAGTSADANAETQQWRDELLQELSLLEGTMVRIQMLRRSNAIERERYAQSKIRILEAAQNIRTDTAGLHVRLEEASNTMALRKQYDELTEKITSNRMLRPREESLAQLDKLTGEITELEQEALDYKQTWAERREQFGRIVEEGRQMLRLIKDEKEEAERKEGMDGGDDGDDETRTRGQGSVVGTPAPGGSTPMRTEDTHESSDRVLPPSFRLLSPSHTGSRAQTPLQLESGSARDGNEEDVEMAEAMATTAAQSDADSTIEEGEADEDDEPSAMEA